MTVKNNVAPRWKRGASPSPLIPYIVAGDPDLATTATYLDMAAKKGIFAVELGIPFSDPTADGPVIQAASQRALRHETSLESILGWLSGIPRNKLPGLYLMTYFNLFHHMGVERFCREAQRSGRIAGVVIPDLSYEDGALYRPVFRRYGINVVGFVSPTTPPERARRIVRDSRGFVYYVGLMGTTGSALTLSDETRQVVSTLRQWTRIPVCVGFGISSGEMAEEILEFADGVIVGSRLVLDERDPDRWRKTFEEFLNAAGKGRK